MSIELITQQIREKCICFKDETEENLLPLVNQLVYLLSLSTCWTLKSCETLLTSERSERILLPCLECNPCGNIERFRPYYQFNIVSESLKIYVHTRNGLHTETIELEPDEYSITDIKGYTEFLFDYTQYASLCECPSCDESYIEFKYLSGFDVLPDCLFPQLCDLLKTISASLLGCGDLDTCCEMTQKEVGYILTNKRMGELSYTWKKDTETVEYLYNQMIIKGRFKAFGMISLCGTDIAQYRNKLWVITNDMGDCQR